MDYRVTVTRDKKISKSFPPSAGTPQPEIVWYKDAVPISPVKIPRYRVLVGGSLQINGLLPDDTGMFQCFARNLAGEIQTNTYLAVTSMSPLKFFFKVIHTSADSFCLSFSSVLPLFSFLILSCPSLCLPFLHPSIYISLCSDRFVSLGCSGNYCLFLNERMSRRSRETEAPCQILRAVSENET